MIAMTGLGDGRVMLEHPDGRRRAVPAAMANAMRERGWYDPERSSPSTGTDRSSPRRPGQKGGALQTNHIRWHVRRGKIVPGCQWCEPVG